MDSWNRRGGNPRKRAYGVAITLALSGIAILAEAVNFWTFYAEVLRVKPDAPMYRIIATIIAIGALAIAAALVVYLVWVRRISKWTTFPEWSLEAKTVGLRPAIVGIVLYVLSVFGLFFALPKLDRESNPANFIGVVLLLTILVIGVWLSERGLARWLRAKTR